MTRKLAERVVAWRWFIIAGWIVLGALLVVLAPSLNNFTSSGYGLPASYQSTQAEAIALKDFPSVASASGIIAVNAANNSVLTAADLQKIDALATALDGDHIGSVVSVTTSPLFLSKNQKIQLIEVTMTGQPGDDGPNAAVTTLRSDTDTFLAGSGLRGQLTGNAAISVDQASEFNRAEKIISIATVLLILVLLALVFHSVIIAVLPLLVVGLVHQMAQSLTAFFAQWLGFSVGTELAPLLIVVMFGVGTDYIVFMLFRYREQLGKGQEPHESLMVALCRAGEVIASAAVTVMLAFAALLVASIGQLRSLAPGLIIGVGLMLLAALTLVPAVLSLFGAHRLLALDAQASRPGPPDAVGTDGRGRGQAPRHCAPGQRRRPRGPGQRRPRPQGHVQPAGGAPAEQSVDRGLQHDLLRLPRRLPGAEPGLRHRRRRRSMRPQSMRWRPSSPIPRAWRRSCPRQYAAGNSAAMIEFLLTDDPYSNQAIADMAGPIRAAIVDAVPGATVVTGGPTATLTDVKAALQIDTRNILLLALLAVAVMLAILLRALAGAAYLLIGILLTYAATIGVVAYIFIRGLGFDGLDFSIPIVAYIFVIAVGTDYNILMATRLREEFRAGRRAARGGPHLHCRGRARRDGGRDHSGGDVRFVAADRDPAAGGDRRGGGPRRAPRLQRAGDADCAHAGRLAGIPFLVAPPHAHQDRDRPGGARLAPAQRRPGLGGQRTGLRRRSNCPVVPAPVSHSFSRRVELSIGHGFPSYLSPRSPSKCMRLERVTEMASARAESVTDANQPPEGG